MTLTGRFGKSLIIETSISIEEINANLFREPWILMSIRTFYATLVLQIGLKWALISKKSSILQVMHEDGVRVSCFHGRIEKVVIHMPGESDYEILRALSFSHIRLSKTVLLQWPQRRSKDMKARKRYLILNGDEWRIVLNRLRSKLIAQGRYTDAVDEIIIKMAG